MGLPVEPMKELLVLPPLLATPFSPAHWWVLLSVISRSSPSDQIFLVFTAFFMHQFKCECRFSNGLERMQFFARYIYNTEEDVHFDSDVGEFTAMTELGRPDAEYWNQQKDFMEQMQAKVDTVCRSNYLGIGSFMRPRRGERGRSVASRRLCVCVCLRACVCAGLCV